MPFARFLKPARRTSSDRLSPSARQRSRMKACMASDRGLVDSDTKKPSSWSLGGLATPPRWLPCYYDRILTCVSSPLAWTPPCRGWQVGESASSHRDAHWIRSERVTSFQVAVHKIRCALLVTVPWRLWFQCLGSRSPIRLAG